MTIQYSIQPSTLSPTDVEVPYGRYQVSSNGLLEIPPLNVTKETIVTALKAGNTVDLISSDGALIGSLLPTVKGGFILSEEPTPNASSVNIGFRPSVGILADLRFEITFERVATSVVLPQISEVEIWVAGGYDPLFNTYPVGSPRDATCIFKGSNLNLANLTGISTIWNGVEQSTASPSQVVSVTNKRITAIIGFRTMPDPVPSPFPANLQWHLVLANGKECVLNGTAIDGTDYT